MVKGELDGQLTDNATLNVTFLTQGEDICFRLEVFKWSCPILVPLLASRFLNIFFCCEQLVV